MFISSSHPIPPPSHSDLCPCSFEPLSPVFSRFSPRFLATVRLWDASCLFSARLPHHLIHRRRYRHSHLCLISSVYTTLSPSRCDINTICTLWLGHQKFRYCLGSTALPRDLVNLATSATNAGGQGFPKGLIGFFMVHSCDRGDFGAVHRRSCLNRGCFYS